MFRSRKSLRALPWASVAVFRSLALDGLAIPLSAVSGNVVCGCCEMIFYSLSLSRERDIYVYFRHVFSFDGKFSIIIATRVQFLN